MNKIINMERKMFDVGKCCISGKPLHTSKKLNWVQVNKKATWPFPVWGNFISGHKGMAVAYVHDDCIINDCVVGEIIHAVEFRDEEIIYHTVKDLQ